MTRFAKEGGEETVIEQIAPQTLKHGARIGGLYWFRIASLGKVLYRPRRRKDESTSFVCGVLQGIIMPLSETK